MAGPAPELVSCLGDQPCFLCCLTRLTLTLALCRGSIDYLDATCLLYGAERTFLEAVDFRYTVSLRTQVPGAVRHSGDIIADGQGTHRIVIAMNSLGWAMVTCLSSIYLACILQSDVPVSLHRAEAAAPLSILSLTGTSVMHGAGNVALAAAVSPAKSRAI